jgi:hypothetical protein
MRTLSSRAGADYLKTTPIRTLMSMTDGDPEVVALRHTTSSRSERSIASR